MSDSYRTNITLSKVLWDFIDNSIGVLGFSRSDVVGRILYKFFSKESIRNEIKSMKEDWVKILKEKREKEARKKINYKDKIKQLLEISKRIPKDTFIDHLNIDKRFFHDHIYEWAKEFNFEFDKDIIIKID